jgi:2-dehydro-3-deoxyphosphogluconate aldolase/(4S)-4-hydroxy-2-oxoglutarate aldolase
MHDLLQKHRIIPVITIHDATHTVPLIQALNKGGIFCAEITLRTDCALEAIRLAKQHCPDTCIAAGTVITIDQLLQLQALEVDFVVSPGTTDELLAVTQQLQLPYLPGVMTPSEIMRCAEHGLNIVKLFPANLAGGMAAIKQYKQLFPSMQFCPTGGINQYNAHDCLTAENVAAVGGSWLAPASLVKQENWSAITDMAKKAATLC